MIAWDFAMTGHSGTERRHGSCSLDGFKASCWGPARTMLLLCWVSSAAETVDGELVLQLAEHMWAADP